jgi:hypothetical protein
MGATRRAAGLLLLLGAAGLGSGCASLPYRAGQGLENERTLKLRPGEPQVVRGRPSRFLDASDWIWPGSLLGKLVLWNYKVDRHEISSETEEVLRAYLAANDLRHVKVRLNGYQVGDEWRRTFRNRAVGAGWRYTMGVLSCVGYTVMPGRFFGGDHYNPYANTVNLYSDIPAVAVHEGAHAKDFAGRTWKGTYAFLYTVVPFFNLYPEAIATSDAVSYLRAAQPRDLQRQGYQVLYPAYGTYLGGGIGEFIPPYGYVAYAVGVIPGHIAGRIRAATLPREAPPAPTPPAP